MQSPTRFPKALGLSPWLPQHRQIAFLSAIFAVLALAILGPLLLPGYVLTFDMPFGPRFPFTDYLWGFDVPALGGFWPLLALLQGLGHLVPAWLLQKVALFGIFVLASLSAATTVPSERLTAKLTAGLIYSVNPFVYIRLIAGHWLLLLGYALLPWAVVCFKNMLERRDAPSITLAAGVTALVGVFSVHMLLLAFLVQAVIGLVYLVRESKTSDKAGFIGTGAIYVAALLGLSAYWVLPVLASSGRGLVPSLGVQDLVEFSARPDQSTILLTLLTLLGLQGYIVVEYIRPMLASWMYLLIVPTLLLTIWMVLERWRNPLVLGLAIGSLLAIPLAWGINWPMGSVNTWLFANVPGFTVFRDTHKYLALISLAYALCSGLAVDHLLSLWGRQSRKKWVGMGVAAVVLVAQGALTWPIWGWQGQVQPVSYPEGWRNVADELKQDQDRAALVLPWHQYMDYSWLPQSQQRLKEPATHYFPGQVIVAANTERGGIYSQELDKPVQGAIEGLLFQPGTQKLNSTNQLGAELARLNVGWVILAKEADYLDYITLLDGQESLVPELDAPTIRLYRNVTPTSAAYASAGSGSIYGKSVPYRQFLPVYWKVDGRSVTAEALSLNLVPPNFDGRAWVGGKSLKEDAVRLEVERGRTSGVWYWPFLVNLLAWTVTLLSCTAGAVFLRRHWRQQLQQAVNKQH